MQNPGTDNNNIGPQDNNQQSDLAAKGGPASGLGTSDGKHAISKPYEEDLQTQIVASNNRKKKKLKGRGSDSAVLAPV